MNPAERLLESIIDATGFMGAQFDDPEDDWPPQIFIAKGNELQVLLIEPAIFDTREGKRTLVAAVAQKVREERSEAVGTLVGAFAMQFPKTGHPEVPPEGVPR